MKSKVSVILTVLNEVDSLCPVLENLLSQSRKPDEIVIVDGGSSNGTIELVEQFAGNEDAIKLMVQKGINISEGRNIAIKHATFPLIAATEHFSSNKIVRGPNACLDARFSRAELFEFRGYMSLLTKHRRRTWFKDDIKPRDFIREQLLNELNRQLQINIYLSAALGVR